MNRLSRSGVRVESLGQGEQLLTGELRPVTVGRCPGP
jgi:hypothetical protein